MVVHGSGPFGRHSDFYCFDGIRMREYAPACCPDGHPLDRRQVLVGTHPCLCAGTSHRTWRCVTCDLIWITPGCALHPEWPAWAGSPAGDLP